MEPLQIILTVLALASNAPAVLKMAIPYYKRRVVRALADDFHSKHVPDENDRAKRDREVRNKLNSFCAFRALPRATKELCFDLGRVTEILKTPRLQEIKGDGDSCLRQFFLYDRHVLPKDDEVWGILEKIFELDNASFFFLRNHPGIRGSSLIEIAVGTDRAELKKQISQERLDQISMKLKKRLDQKELEETENQSKSSSN